MSKRVKRDRLGPRSEIVSLSLSEDATPESMVAEETGNPRKYSLKNRLWTVGAITMLFLLGLGVMGMNNWLPHSDSNTGKKVGWFGREVSKNSSINGNPLVIPSPNATPQYSAMLSKEYIYAGSRVLAVEDANAINTDLAVWRPGTGVWYVLGGPGSTQTFYQWGQIGDVPVQGDFDGDGKTDFSVWRSTTGIWFVTYSSTGQNTSFTLQFGAGCSSYPTGCDVPAPADYDGDGKTDLAVWRPSTGVWFYYLSTTGFSSYNTVQYGQNGDTPVPADYFGIGRATFAVWRPSLGAFFIKSSDGSTESVVSLGSIDDRSAPGDFDGDGKVDLAVFNDLNAKWIIRQSSNGQTQEFSVGSAGDVLVPNDYDGDGRCDVATWNPENGIWTIRRSSSPTPFQSVQWGQKFDIPVPAYYRR